MVNYDKESQLKSAAQAQQRNSQTAAYDTNCEAQDTRMGSNAKAGAIASGLNPNYRPSPLDDMERIQQRESEAAQLRSEGIEFLRANPAFDQFIVLIRKGAIGI